MEKFFTWPVSVTRKWQITARPLGNFISWQHCCFNWDNPVATTTCSSQSHHDKHELYESDNAHDPDSEEERAESERHRSLGNLDEQDYQLIMSPHGWLDDKIIHSAQVLLQEITPLIEGFQQPTLGPVWDFSVVSGKFVQILHTGQNHWVCVSSVWCIAGRLTLFGSLYYDIISQEVEDQVRNLLAHNFQKLCTLPTANK